MRQGPYGLLYRYATGVSLEMQAGSRFRRVGLPVARSVSLLK
jgi:hypothetical protein